MFIRSEIKNDGFVWKCFLEKPSTKTITHKCNCGHSHKAQGESCSPILEGDIHLSDDRKYRVTIWGSEFYGLETEDCNTKKQAISWLINKLKKLFQVDSSQILTPKIIKWQSW